MRMTAIRVIVIDNNGVTKEFVAVPDKSGNPPQVFYECINGKAVMAYRHPNLDLLWKEIYQNINNMLSVRTNAS